ncbi:MAG: Smr/MutS family protein [Candidatus Omnitrophica bacterium]|nr:Smr/MutS family protein [Candidatus Omnitrophota bacterium]
MGRIKLDLHEIFNQGQEVERHLQRAIDEAVAKRIQEIEIIPGKGSGQLKKTVVRFLNRPEIKKLYHRLDIDNKNFGRLFVYFRHKG